MYIHTYSTGLCISVDLRSFRTPDRFSHTAFSGAVYSWRRSKCCSRPQARLWRWGVFRDALLGMCDGFGRAEQAAGMNVSFARWEGRLLFEADNAKEDKNGNPGRDQAGMWCPAPAARYRPGQKGGGGYLVEGPSIRCCDTHHPVLTHSLIWPLLASDGTGLAPRVLDRFRSH